MVISVVWLALNERYDPDGAVWFGVNLLKFWVLFGAGNRMALGWILVGDG